MGLDKGLRKTFGTISELYDSARESYPVELINDILHISKINKTGRILEVGSGSGKATYLFAQKGYKIVGLDISRELIEIVQKNTSQFTNVSYQITSFEEADLRPNTFYLIFSAQAWHWLNSKVAYKKAHDLLVENGVLALFWKTLEYEKLKFLQRLRKLYIRHCPKYHDPVAVKNAEVELSKSNLFSPYEKREYFVELKFDKERFIQLVSTMSWVIALSDKNKELFLSKLSQLVEQQDETFSIPYKYTLLTAKKKS